MGDRLRDWAKKEEKKRFCNVLFFFLPLDGSFFQKTKLKVYTFFLWDVPLYRTLSLCYPAYVHRRASPTSIYMFFVTFLIDGVHLLFFLVHSSLIFIFTFIFEQPIVSFVTLTSSVVVCVHHLKLRIIVFIQLHSG